MDFTGTFSDLMVDFSTGKQKAVLTLNEDARQTFENLKDNELSISIKNTGKRGAWRPILTFMSLWERLLM